MRPKRIMRTRTRRTRTLGGVVFECLEPGTWMSLDRTLCIVETFGLNKWELYRTQLATGEVRVAPKKLIELTGVKFSMHDMIEYQPRFKDLDDEVERAADWTYNLASGFFDMAKNEMFYRNGNLESSKPTLEKPVSLDGTWAIWRSGRLPRSRP
jgi:hypothetical protein